MTANDDRRLPVRYVCAASVAAALVLVCLVTASIPARLILSRVIEPRGGTAFGTIWVGTVILPGDVALTWRTQPVSSLLAMRLKASFNLNDAGMASSGQLEAGAGTLSLSAVNGQLRWSTSKALAKSPGPDCNLSFRLTNVSLTRKKSKLAGSGTMTTSAGTCRLESSSPEFAIPATIVRLGADGPALKVMAELANDRSVKLLGARIEPAGKTRLEIFPAAISLVPAEVGSERPTAPIILEIGDE